MSGLRALLAMACMAAGGVALAHMPQVERTPSMEGTQERIDVIALLNLDAARAQRVQAVFERARERMRVAQAQVGPPADATAIVTLHAAMEAIRADTEEKLAAILTDDELARLHRAAPPPPTRLEPLRFKRV
jgi:hypothetical protein